MSKSSAMQALLESAVYIHNPGISDTELEKITKVLRTIKNGNVHTLLSASYEEEIDLGESVREYFLKNPNHFVTLVGDCKIPQSQVVGIARSFNVERKHLRFHTDYTKLKQQFPFEEIGHDGAVAVILGSVPHSVERLGDFTSPRQAVEGLVTLPRKLFIPPELKLTKMLLKRYFREFARHIHELVVHPEQMQA